MQIPRFFRFLIVFAFCAAPAVFAQTIPANTAIAVRLDQNVNSGKAIVNQRIKARIASDIVVDGDIVLPKGAMAAVYVERVQPGDSSRPAGLWLRLDAIAVDGRAYPVTARSVGEQMPVSAAAGTQTKLETVSETSGQNPDNPDQVTYHSATVVNFQLESAVHLR